MANPDRLESSNTSRQSSNRGHTAVSALRNTPSIEPSAPFSFSGENLASDWTSRERRPFAQLQLKRGAAGDESVDGSSPDIHQVAGAGVSGAGDRLPYLETIQRSFGGHDVSGVSAHTDGK